MRTDATDLCPGRVHHIMWSDDETTVAQMRGDVGRFIEERDWGRYHTPVNVASAMAVEAGELLELFQWRRPDDTIPEEVVADAGGELADVFHFALCLMNTTEGAMPSDPRTVSDLLEDGEAIGVGPKETAEEVLIGTTFVLMSARASELAREIADAMETGGPEDALIASMDYLLTALARCARSLGLDLSRELEQKNMFNEERYPVGSRPDVGY